jgi:hypothetical protein
MLTHILPSLSLLFWICDAGRAGRLWLIAPVHDVVVTVLLRYYSSCAGGNPIIHLFLQPVNFPI